MFDLATVTVVSCQAFLNAFAIWATAFSGTLSRSRRDFGGN